MKQYSYSPACLCPWINMLNRAITMKIKSCAVEELVTRNMKLGLNEIENEVEYREYGIRFVEEWYAVDMFSYPNSYQVATVQAICPPLCITSTPQVSCTYTFYTKSASQMSIVHKIYFTDDGCT